MLGLETAISELPTKHISAKLDGRTLAIDGRPDVQVSIYNLSGQKSLTPNENARRFTIHFIHFLSFCHYLAVVKSAPRLTTQRTTQKKDENEQQTIYHTKSIKSPDSVRSLASRCCWKSSNLLKAS